MIYSGLGAKHVTINRFLLWREHVPAKKNMLIVPIEFEFFELVTERAVAKVMAERCYQDTKKIFFCYLRRTKQSVMGDSLQLKRQPAFLCSAVLLLDVGEEGVSTVGNTD